MSVINSIPLIAAGDDGYQISRSVRLRSSASAYFNRTQASGNNQKFTLSQWVKRGKLGATQYLLTAFNATTDGICFTGSDQLEVFFANGSTYDLITTAVYRDPSAWYHVVVSVDTTQATASNRVQLFVNNVAVSFTGTQPTQNYTFPNINANTVVARIGTQSTGVNYLDGYLTEVNFIDGQALTPSSFGEFDAVTGVWKPKKYTGTYGTNGFYLNFSDNSAATAAAIGKDYSGNGNNWTPNNISVTAGVTYDSMLDVPTLYADGGNGRGNYAVLNPLVPTSIYNGILSNGNLTATLTATTQINCHDTMAIPQSGKWYCEVQVVNPSAYGVAIGIEQAPFNAASGVFNGVSYYSANGNKYISGVASAYGTAWASGTNTIGLAVDSVAGTVAFYLNNVSQGAISIATGVDWYFGGTHGSGSGSHTENWNFGQQPFAYTPPTGFKALNTQNLPDSTIKKGNTYFDATTYTGTGSALSITNTASFQPDLVWIKGRSGATNHALYDAVRGTTLDLVSNSTAAETTQATGLTAFNSNGFTVGALAKLNTSSSTYVGWQWKESASAGFDIVTYTGNGTARTIAHSLGVKPSMIILKNRSGAYDWPTWHQYLPNPTTQHFWLNATNAAQVSGSFNSTQPTSSVFSVGTTSEANANGNNFVAYLFAEVAGFSKFGSYTGNGSTDGPFVYCGFKPKFVLVKRTDTTANWIMLDTSVNTYNVADKYLNPNLSDAEGTLTLLDIISNGFKLRTSSATAVNASGGTYIYAAFAENPFKYSLGR